MSMIAGSVASVGEIRTHALDSKLLKHLQSMKESPQWMREEGFDVGDAKVDEFVRQFQKTKVEKEAEADFTSVRVTESSLINSGLFGPPVEEYAMPLPFSYPKLAGQAREALKPGLIEHEKALSKLRVTGLPTTLEEVYIPTTQEKLTAWYHRQMKTKEKQERADLEAALEPQVRVGLVSESLYCSGRRPTYVHLPGMARHVPNPLYTSPALIVPDVNYIEQNLPPAPPIPTVKVYNKKQLKINVVPPVGRKPTPQQLEEYRLITTLLEADKREALRAKEQAALAAAVEAAEQGESYLYCLSLVGSNIINFSQGTRRSARRSPCPLLPLCLWLEMSSMGRY